MAKTLDWDWEAGKKKVMYLHPSIQPTIHAALSVTGLALAEQAHSTVEDTPRRTGMEIIEQSQIKRKPPKPIK
jgi:hypothetical protein